MRPDIIGRLAVCYNILMRFSGQIEQAVNVLYALPKMFVQFKQIARCKLIYFNDFELFTQNLFDNLKLCGKIYIR